MENNNNTNIETNLPKMMTIREVAKTGILSEGTLRRLYKSGELPCINVGNRVLINFDNLIDKLNGVK